MTFAMSFADEVRLAITLVESVDRKNTRLPKIASGGRQNLNNDTRSHVFSPYLFPGSFGGVVLGGRRAGGQLNTW
jgi:hypothetical protein